MATVMEMETETAMEEITGMVSGTIMYLAITWEMVSLYMDGKLHRCYPILFQNSFS